MKFIRSFFTGLIAIMLLCQCAIAQFKNTVGGYAYESKAVFSAIGYSRVGGGVILRGTAKPDESHESIVFTDAYIVQSQGISTIFFTTNECPVKYSGNFGVMKDALSVVNGSSVITHDVNLLSTPDSVKERFHKLLYPSTEYFYVEVNKNLIGTKTGENLLLVDLIQTDPQFYSDSSLTDAYDSFRYVLDSLTISSLKSLLEKSDSLSNHARNDSMLIAQIKYVNALSKAHLYNELFEKNDTDYLYMKEYIKSLAFSAVGLGNWTYNDEMTDYRFTCNCVDSTLIVTGEPYFTYLKLRHENVGYTKFFRANKNMITDLRPSVFSYADEYAQTASFFRYIKRTHPSVWRKIVKHFEAREKLPGNTPRIIER